MMTDHYFEPYLWDPARCGYVDGDDMMCGYSREDHAAIDLAPGSVLDDPLMTEFWVSPVTARRIELNLADIQMGMDLFDASPDGQAEKARSQAVFDALPWATVQVSGRWGCDGTCPDCQGPNGSPEPHPPIG